MVAKHSKSFSLIDCVSVGVDRLQRNFKPMRNQVQAWQRSELTDLTAKVVIYEAFVEGRLEAPNISPGPRMICALSRSMRSSGHERFGVCQMLTSAFKELDPIPQFRATRSWESSWRPGSRRLANHAWRYRPGRRSFMTPFAQQALRAGGRFPRPTDFPVVSLWPVSGWPTTV